MIVAVGQTGCGFEAPLEAMYRFLADPDPPESVVVQNGQSAPQGTDTTVLSERAAFLRPDSAVMVVVLSDENDCSIIDSGLGWLVGHTSVGSSIQHLPRATSACATDPNSPCCRSCHQNESSPPSGCTPLSQDPSCQINGGYYDDQGDQPNLRCFDQKRRFGLSLLYPTSRYHDALRLTKICPNELDLACRSGDTPVQNPLFAGGRSPTLVSFGVITGVPWQDLARDPSNTQALSFMSAAELSANGRWTMILGDPKNYVPPTDPFMRESIDARSGENPVTGDAIEPSNTTTPNPINGHEYDIPNRGDLQFACTFELPAARNCLDQTQSCDCNPETLSDTSNSPLCQADQTGPTGTTQYYAKAYPGRRELEVARDLGYKSVVGSICPRTLTSPSRSDDGYAPSVQALIERLASVLR